MFLTRLQNLTHILWVSFWVGLSLVDFRSSCLYVLYGSLSVGPSGFVILYGLWVSVFNKIRWQKKAS